MIEYLVQGADQTLVLADGVVEHLLSNRQTKRWSSEAGNSLPVFRDMKFLSRKPLVPDEVTNEPG